MFPTTLGNHGHLVEKTDDVSSIERRLDSCQLRTVRLCPARVAASMNDVEHVALSQDYIEKH